MSHAHFQRLSHVRKALKAPAWRGMIAVTAGTLSGQVVTFVALPILARLYSPTEFGVLTYVTALIALVIPVAILRMDQAVIIPKDDNEVAPLLAASVTCLAFFACITAILFTFFPHNLPGSLANANPYVSLAATALLILTGLSALCGQLAVREQRYGYIGRRNSIQSVGITAGQLALSPFRGLPGFPGLLLGNALGSAVGTLSLLPVARKYIRRTSLSECLAALRRFWRFPVLFGPIAVITLLVQQGPALFLTTHFGLAAGGIIGVSERLLNIPMALLGAAVGIVFDGRLAASLREGTNDQLRVYMRTTRWLLGVGGAIGFGIYFAGPVAAPWLLGGDWSQAGIILQTMALTASTRIISFPTRRTLQLMEYGKAAIGVEMQRMLLLALAVAASVLFPMDFPTTTALLFASLALGDVIAWLFTFLTLSRHNRHAGR